MSEQSTEFNHDAYKENLINIITLGREHYKMVSLEWRNRQTTILKTYLWVSVTLLAAEFSLFSPMWVGHSPLFLYKITPNCLFMSLSILSIVCSLAVFAFGIDSLRGRKAIFSPYFTSLSQLCDKAYLEAKGDTPLNQGYVLQIKEVESAINEQLTQNVHMGTKLRIMSWFLLVSFILAVISFICAMHIYAATSP